MTSDTPSRKRRGSIFLKYENDILLALPTNLRYEIMWKEMETSLVDTWKAFQVKNSQPYVKSVQ